uniref:RING-type E3 ubiquitin transferase n=1 Tax=Steinernema glaseri TaxID=37863 RepID=A0A1I7Y2U7_9BILA
MADSRPICRYFVNNCCRKGDRCSFSHDRNSRQDLTCRFYNQGYCAYGANCRYDHVRTSPTSSTETAYTVRREQNRTADVCKNDKKTYPSISSNPFSNAESSNQPRVLCSSMSPNAPIFVPSWLKNIQAGHGELEDLHLHEKQRTSYASAVGYVLNCNMAATAFRECKLQAAEFREELLCPYNEEGACPHPNCQFLHGDVCELCGKACLNPLNEDQQKQHRRECIAEHEKAMEDAFAAARTIDKNCGICMENVWEKNGRFGILNNCRHCFCLECIRKWRKSQQFEHKTTRSCPECRTHSDFVIPASHWIEDPTEKERLITLYRDNTSKKMCKYFKPGDPDSCRFGNKCFYRHENQDGSPARCDSPNTINRRSRQRAPRLVEYIIDESVYWSSDDEPTEADYLREILTLGNVDLQNVDW